MKIFNFCFFLLLIVTVSPVFGQKVFRQGIQNSKKPKVTAATQTFTADTLTYDIFLESTPTVYDAPSSGYASGNNQYGDRIKAQAYPLDSSTVLVEVLLWFGVKKGSSNNPNSKLVINLQEMDGPGTTTFGTTEYAPGSIKESVDLLFSDIDTTQLTSVSFAPDYRLYDDFAISVDFTTLAAGDTVGLYSTTNGDALPQRSWEQWSDSTWHTMLNAWSLEIDFAMWPVVDWTTSGIDSPTFFQGLKMSQNAPNPCNGQSTIQYELAEFTQHLSFEIFDLAGKKVYQSNSIGQNAGLHNLIVDISDLSPGTYYYSLTNGEGRLTKKMILAE